MTTKDNNHEETLMDFGKERYVNESCYCYNCNNSFVAIVRENYGYMELPDICPQCEEEFCINTLGMTAEEIEADNKAAEAF